MKNILFILLIFLLISSCGAPRTRIEIGNDDYHIEAEAQADTAAEVNSIMTNNFILIIILLVVLFIFVKLIMIRKKKKKNKKRIKNNKNKARLH